jgi:phytoene synthase
MDMTSVFNQCEKVIRHHSASFYKAFRELASPRREAVYVIYAFCRMIDDSVDEPERSQYTLDELERGLLRLEDAEGHFIWPALRWLFDSFPVRLEPFLLQIQGQRLDLKQTHYATLDELDHYCRLVAGTVGEMLLPVLHDAPHASIEEEGVWLGKAMQIVNIIRDVGEDRARGRRYIPLEWMRRAGYSEEEFAAGLVNDSFRRLIRELEELARNWFIKGMNGLSEYPVLSAASIELAAGFYEAILNEVKLNDYQVFTKRAVVSPAAKLLIYLRVKAKYAGGAAAEQDGAVS